MSADTDPKPPQGTPAGTARARQPGQPVRHENPTTQQMRIIGQRRKDAEEKLAHHLEHARHLHPEKHATGDSEDHP